MSREAALKAWATRRARGGGARILTTGKRAMATNLGGRARPAPAAKKSLTAALKASLKPQTKSQWKARQPAIQYPGMTGSAVAGLKRKIDALKAAGYRSFPR